MGPGLIPKPLAIGIAVVITAVWAASQLGTLFVPDYEAPDAIHAALMIVLGTVFATVRRGDAEKDDNGDDPDEAPDPEPERPRPRPALPRQQPPRSESAADMIARLQRERDGDRHDR